MKKYLLAITVLLIGSCGLWVFNYDAPVKPVPTVTEAAPITHPMASEIAEYVNVERDKAGLERLVEDPRLDASAAAKCADMVSLNYWNHDRPDGTEPWHFFYEQGIPLGHLGENLAYGQHTSQQVTTSWMNSPEHRENILNPNYSEVGFAVCHSSNFVGTNSEDVIVQHLAGL